MTKKGYVADEVLANVNVRIFEAEDFRKKYGRSKRFLISDVYDELSIFDWWNEYLSLSQLKQMKKFLEQAISRGFDGYVCFKVGAKHCSHGMWAHKNISENGYSPDGDVLYHSFRSGDNYWDAKINGEWLHDSCEDGKYEFTLKDIDEQLAK